MWKTCRFERFERYKTLLPNHMRVVCLMLTFWGGMWKSRGQHFGPSKLPTITDRLSTITMGKMGEVGHRFSLREDRAKNFSVGWAI